MNAAALPATTRTYRLAQVLDFDLLNRPVSCYTAYPPDGILCQVLRVTLCRIVDGHHWYNIDAFNTEMGEIEDWLVRDDSPVLVVREEGPGT